MGTRHINNLLAGAKVLIGTQSKFSIPEIPDRNSILDILVHWEAKGVMGPFLATHLSYVGLMAEEVVHTIMDSTRISIQESNFRVKPFHTSAFRLHVGGSSPKPRSAISSLKSPTKSQRRKIKAVEAVDDDPSAGKKAKSASKSKGAFRKKNSRVVVCDLKPRGLQSVAIIQRSKVR